MQREWRGGLDQFVPSHFDTQSITEILATGGPASVGVEWKKTGFSAERVVDNRTIIWSGTIMPHEVDDITIVVRNGPVQIGIRFGDGVLDWSSVLEPQEPEPEPDPEPEPKAKASKKK